MKARLGCFLLFSLVLSACAGLNVPPVSSLDSLVIGMPVGEYSLRIFADGSSAYSYGAHPEMGGSITIPLISTKFTGSCRGGSAGASRLMPGLPVFNFAVGVRIVAIYIL